MGQTVFWEKIFCLLFKRFSEFIQTSDNWRVLSKRFEVVVKLALYLSKLRFCEENFFRSFQIQKFIRFWTEKHWAVVRVFSNRVVEKALNSSGGSVWQSSCSKKHLFRTKKDGGDVFGYWLKTIRNVCQTTSYIVSRKFFFWGNVDENFHRKLSYEILNVRPKNLNIVKRHLLGEIIFVKTLNVCQSLKEHNWARLSEIDFLSRE